MAELTYILRHVGCFACDNCQYARPGTGIVFDLRTGQIPGLPSSIRGVVQSVQFVTGIPTAVTDGGCGNPDDILDYEITYESDDLNGAIDFLQEENINMIRCVSDLTLAKEYVDEVYGDLPQEVEDAIADLEAAVAANRYVDMPNNSDNISKTYYKAYDAVLLDPETIRSINVDFNNDFLANLPDEDYVAGRHYRVDIVVSITTENNANSEDSYAEVAHIGVMSQGSTVFTKHEEVSGSDSLSSVRAGEMVNIAFQNNSQTINKMMHVQATLVIFNQTF